MASEVYCVTTSAMIYSGQAGHDDGLAGDPFRFLEELLHKAGIQPDWISEIMWLADPGLEPLYSQQMVVAGVQPNIPVFSWPWKDGLDHFLLQSAYRAILTDASRIIVIVHQAAFGLAGAILAAPRAIGGHNILPKYRFPAAYIAHWPLAEGVSPIEYLAMRMKKDLIDPGSVVLAAAPFSAGAPRQLTLEGAFPSAAWMLRNQAAHQTLFLFADLARALQKHPAGLGICLWSQDGLLKLATLVEAL